MMRNDRIADIFRDHGQYVTGRERALICAIAEAVAPKRTWMGLTDEDLAWCNTEEYKTARYWETKLKEKNS